MSNKLTAPDFIQIPKPVLTNVNLQPSDKFLFGYIYWLTKLKLEKCTASNQKLAELSGLTEGSINNALRRLEQEGLIHRELTGSGPRAARVIHCLMQYSKVVHQMMYDTTSGDVRPLSSPTPVPNKNSNNNKKEHSSKKSDLLIEIIAIINPNEKPTVDRQRKLGARLEDYSGEEIVAAARELAKSDWHRENKQMTIDNLLARSKFGRWYSASKQQDKEIIF